jgi:alkylhydroperoxidase family enzyme
MLAGDLARCDRSPQGSRSRRDVTLTRPAVSSCPTGNRETEDTMTLRVSKAELPTELSDSMIKQFGVVPEPVEVTWHSPPVSETSLELGRRVSGWDEADESLKSFAHMAVAAQVGCSFCLDVGYFQAQNQNLDMNKAGEVPRWRQSDAFTPSERDVLEYAEAMTNTPPTVTDELSARLLERLGSAAMIELTAFIAFSNFSTRTNTALGIESQGFSTACEVPPPARSEIAA